MKKRIWEIRIPTLLGLGLLIMAIFITSKVLQIKTNFIGKASSGSQPENVKISNVTDSSFNISFTTNELSQSSINYGETEELGSIAYDVRDKNSHYSHLISISELKPNTKYYFSIISNGDNYLNENQKFMAQTGTTLSSSPTNNFKIEGKIVDANDEKGDDTLILLNIDNSQSISSITKETGDYSIDLSNIRDINLENYSNITDGTFVNISFTKRGNISNVKLKLPMESLPIITLGQNYDFSQDTTEQQESTMSSQLEIDKSNSSTNFEITSPENNELIIDKKPLFTGKADPEKKIKIIINSQTQIQAETITDKSGIWNYKPNQALAPGEHTITIETTDSLGNIKQITRSFTVYADTQVLPSATPSPTPTLFPTTTPSPTLIQPSTVQSTASLSGNLESPGNFSPTVVLTFISILFILTGTSLLYLYK